MSINFTVNDAPYVKRACVDVFPNLTESDFEDWYELGPDGRRYMEVPDFPEVSITESSASILFRLAGMTHLNPADGELSLQEQAKMFSELFKARNDLQAQTACTQRTVQQANFIGCGYSIERIQRLIDAFLELLRYCREHQKPLIWC